MSFIKTGQAPIEQVLCSCGEEIDPKTKKCKKCGKEFNKNSSNTKKED